MSKRVVGRDIHVPVVRIIQAAVVSCACVAAGAMALADDAARSTDSPAVSTNAPSSLDSIDVTTSAPASVPQTSATQSPSTEGSAPEAPPAHLMIPATPEFAEPAAKLENAVVPPPAPAADPPKAVVEAPPPPPPPTPAELLGLTGKERAKAEKCLANAVYFESRGEPIRGQYAVAQVVMNRVFSPYYPKDVCGVVYQNAERFLSCQFTFACDGKSKAIHERGAWWRAQRVAKLTLDGKVWLAAVAKATHYHAYWVNPSWVAEMRKFYRFGVHTFYRPQRWGDGEKELGWVHAPLPVLKPKAQPASNPIKPEANNTQPSAAPAITEATASPATPQSVPHPVMTQSAAVPAPSALPAVTAPSAAKSVILPPANVQAKVVPSAPQSKQNAKPTPAAAQPKTQPKVIPASAKSTAGPTKPQTSTPAKNPNALGKLPYGSEKAVPSNARAKPTPADRQSKSAPANGQAKVPTAKGVAKSAPQNGVAKPVHTNAKAQTSQKASLQ